MPSRDPQKKIEYVAKHRAMMKANEVSKKEYIIIIMQVIMPNMQQKKKKNWELMNIIRKKLHICGNTELDKNKHSNK